MRNQPKYNFFKNTKYALDGLCEIYGKESSFRIEIYIIIPLIVVSFFLPTSLDSHIVLIVSLIFVLFAECVNSAIERCVDLCTRDIHPLAKAAKDAGSAAVFLSIVIAAIVWVLTLWTLL